MEDKKKFMQAAGLVVGEPRSPEQMWLRGLIEDLEQAEIESEEGKTYTITAPSCLSKGGLLDIAKVLNALPPEKKIRVALDLSEATGLTYIAVGAFIHCQALESVKLPPSVIEISQHAFSDCDNLTSVEIPPSVTTIGDSAFDSCDNLTSVEIPPSVTTIGSYAFSWCHNLTSVNIPEGVTTIGTSAFSWCDNLSSVDIPPSVTTIGDSAFSECSNLRSVTFQKTDGWHLQELYPERIDEDINVSNPSDNATKLQDGLWRNKRLTRKTESYLEDVMKDKKKFVQAAGLVVGEPLASVENERLREQYWLRSLIQDLEWQVQMQEQIYNLEEQVEQLEQMEAPQEKIEELQKRIEELEADIEMKPYDEAYTISVPSYLSKDGLSDLAKVLNALPFWDTEGVIGLDLSEVTGLTYIAAGAFVGCGVLENVKLPPSVREISQYAFSHCRNLSSVDIPPSVTTIGDSAFDSCHLRSVDIPPSVTTIGSRAFSNCFNLSSVDIPSSVTTIGYHAFYNCERLKTVKVEAETPPALGGDSVFSTDSLTKIQVPSSSVAAYKAAEVWKDYAEKIKPITP